MERGIWDNLADNIMVLVTAGIAKTDSWKQKEYKALNITLAME